MSPNQLISPGVPAATVAAAGITDPAWWAPGLALRERLGTSTPPGDTDNPGPDEEPGFLLRAAGLGLDGAAVRAVADEPRAALAARVPRPGWAAAAEGAVRAALPLRHDEPVPGHWHDAFARVLLPFSAHAVARVVAAAGRLPAGFVDRSAVARDTGDTLDRVLVGLAARTLVTELHHRAAAGRLAGTDGTERFGDFVRDLTGPGALGELLAAYPVLARLLAQAASAAAEATTELLDRLATDRPILVTDLLDGLDPGPVTAVSAGRGDPHGGGRTVAFVDFADGRRIVYKPRDITAQIRFGGVLAALDAAVPGLAPQAVRGLARPGYGWSEYVTGEPLTGQGAADRFYRRQGALLALLHALRATDVHYENLVAHGDHPVLIDAETLFHPALAATGSGDPAADALARSVHRTALLPLMAVGEHGIADLSGLGGDAGRSPTSVVDWLDAGTDRMRMTRRPADLVGSANRPGRDGVHPDPGDHEAAVLAGFRLAYDAVTAHAGRFGALVTACADVEVRVVCVPTWTYRTLLDETTHPDVLRDALDRDRALAVLSAGRTADPLHAQLIEPEMAELWAGDVPLFVTSAGTGRLRTAGGDELPFPLPEAGVAAALRTITAFGEVDRRDQEWIISAALATRRRDTAHPGPTGSVRGTDGPAAHPDQLLAAACAVADRIIAHGVPGDGRVNWLGLEAVDERQWLMLPLGAGLGHGHLGVAVFLAQLAAATGIDRYAGQARLAAAAVPSLVDAITQRPELVDAIGCGGLDGLGGLAYGLSRLHLLLGDPALRVAAVDAVSLAGAAAATGTDAGWATGLAGCLAAMTAVHADLGVDDAAAVAQVCADRLAGRADELAQTLPATFSDGLAGVGWALGTHGPQPRHRQLGRRLVASTATAATRPGWCHGTAGLALAQSCLTDPTAPSLVATALAAGPVGRDLSLCHGELGTTEVLTALAGSAEPGSRQVRDLRRRAGVVLDLLRRHGPVCGTPGGVLTPGLLTGLAGIGHGLLRLAAPPRVPSVLLLAPEPTPTDDHRGPFAGHAPHSTSPHRTSPHRTSPHSTSPQRTPSGATATTKEIPPCPTP